jgi:hypothetical protein
MPLQKMQVWLQVSLIPGHFLRLLFTGRPTTRTTGYPASPWGRPRRVLEPTLGKLLRKTPGNGTLAANLQPRFLMAHPMGGLKIFS